MFCEKTKQEPKEEVIYEDMVCFHLYKQSKEIFYASRKKEMDFLIFLEKKAVGIEVKCQNTINREDYLSFLPVKKGFLITKNKFEVKKMTGKIYYALPIYWFAYLKLDQLNKFSS